MRKILKNFFHFQGQCCICDDYSLQLSSITTVCPFLCAHIIRCVCSRHWCVPVPPGVSPSPPSWVMLTLTPVSPPLPPGIPPQIVFPIFTWPGYILSTPWDLESNQPNFIRWSFEYSEAWISSPQMDWQIIEIPHIEYLMASQPIFCIAGHLQHLPLHPCGLWRILHRFYCIKKILVKIWMKWIRLSCALSLRIRRCGSIKSSEHSAANINQVWTEQQLSS